MNIPDEAWITQWFLTLFVYSFPLEIVIRFWDIILTSNIFMIIKISVAIIKHFENIIVTKDLFELNEFFREL